jgi:glycerol uptake operon antiterminator
LISVSAVRQILVKHPVIPAIRDKKNLRRLPQGTPRCVFLLESSLIDIAHTSAEVSQAGHVTFIHVDLVEGLKVDHAGLRWLMDNVKPHGIISTHRGALDNAKKLGLLRILRVFMLDSEAVEKGKALAAALGPDFVEVLPGVAVPIFSDAILDGFRSPLIAGGLVADHREVHAILSRGVCGVSTSKSTLW